MENKLNDTRALSPFNETESVLINRARDLAKNDHLSHGEDNEATHHVLLFRLADEHYGIETRYVVAITKRSALTILPTISQDMLGVINYHGKMIGVIDLASVFKLSNHQSQEYIVIVQADDCLFAVLVDSVGDIVAYKESDVQHAIENHQHVHSQLIRYVSESNVAVLNIHEFLKNWLNR